MSQGARGDFRAWCWPLAAALALRLLGLAYPHLIDTDGAYYGAAMRWFAAGHWAKALDPVWPPLYPLLASGLMRLGVPVETAGGVVSLLASLACVATTAVLGRAVGGRRAGLIAAWLAAVHPKLVFFSLQLLTESTYAAFTSAALCLFTAGAGPRSAARVALGGACLGAAFLVRPEALALVIPTLVWSVWAPAVPAALGGARSRLRRACLCLAGFSLLALPYVGWVSHIEGRFSPGEKGALNFYLTYRDTYAADGIVVQTSDFAAITAPEIRRRPGEYRVLEFLRRHPGLVAAHTLANLPRALFDKLPGMVGWLPFLLAVAGVGIARQEARLRPSLLWALWIATIALSVAPIFLYRRFFMAAIPPCLAWGALAVDAAWRRWPRGYARAGFAVLGVGLAISGQVALARARPPVLYREAGRALGESNSGTLVLAARKPETAFYAAAEFRPLAAGNLAELREFLGREGVTHLVADDYIFPASHPGLVVLLQPDQAPGWLRLVHDVRGAGHRVLVYAFTP